MSCNSWFIDHLFHVSSSIICPLIHGSLTLPISRTVLCYHMSSSSWVTDHLFQGLSYALISPIIYGLLTCLFQGLPYAFICPVIHGSLTTYFKHCKNAIVCPVIHGSPALPISRPTSPISRVICSVIYGSLT